MSSKLFLSGLIAISMVACNNAAEEATQDSVEETQAVEEATEAELEVYGDESITVDGAIDANELLAMMEGQDSMNVKVRGTINACCQKKGCWMDMNLSDDQSMTVRFKDYGFFVPMNSAGRDAIIEGVAKVDTQSVDWLRHKAEDAGKSEEEIAAITEPKVAVSFLASGVILE